MLLSRQVYVTVDPAIDEIKMHGNFTWKYNDEFDEVRAFTQYCFTTLPSERVAASQGRFSLRFYLFSTR